MDLLDLWRKTRRVLVISKKPSRDEFFEVAKVTGIGIILFGTIGLIIYIIFSLIELRGG